MGYYLLKISIDECLNKKLYDMLYEKYVESSYLHNFMVSRYLNNIDNETFDAGFDLFVVLNHLSFSWEGLTIFPCLFFKRCFLQLIKSAFSEATINII